MEINIELEDSNQIKVWKGNIHKEPKLKHETQQIKSNSFINSWKNNEKIFWFRKRCIIIIESLAFAIIINLSIIINCIIMGLDQFPSSNQQANLLTTSNDFFYTIFVIEMILKMIGLGFRSYIKDHFNKFDFFIILISTIDLILSLAFQNKQSSSLSVFRGFRILRILKIVKSWEKLQELLSTIFNTLKDIRNFFVLLLIWIFAYTLVGVEFFAFKLKFDKYERLNLDEGESPRVNFDGFLNSLFAVFTTIQTNNWHKLMYDLARGVGKPAIIFSIILVVIGQILLLKLILAIILENFEDKRKQLEEQKKYRKSKHIKKQDKLEILIHKIKQFIIKKVCKKCIKKKENLNNTPSTNSNSEVIQSINIDNNNKSLFIFKKQHPLRNFLLLLVNKRQFDYFILCIILILSILQAIENPLDSRQSTKFKVLYWLDVIITIIFISEVVMKIIAYGFLFCGENSYIRSYWNILDFVVVIISIISISTDNNSLKIVKVLRMIRVLRPLRLISRNQGLKLAVKTLISAIPNVINVAIVCLLFYLIFGIFFISILKGQLYYCYYSQIENGDWLEQYIITKFDCINYGGEWINQPNNFDNILNAILFLFAMSLVDWVKQMFLIVDATGIGLQPKHNAHQFWMAIIVGFIFLFSFFLLNLFVGVIVSTFNHQREKLGKNFLLTSTQKEWLSIKKKLLNTKLLIKKNIRSESNPIKRTILQINQNIWFSRFIYACIIINTLILTLNWYQMPNSVGTAVAVFNYIFAAIFALEAIIKIISFGKAYFKDNWNIFDFIVVIISIIGIIIDISPASNSSAGSKTTLLRTFKVVRIFRLINRAKVLRLIVDTFIITLPSFANVGGLLLLIIYVYSILGVQLFAGIKLKSSLNDKVNFQHFGNSFLTLVRIMTGEQWELILSDLVQGYSIINQCDSNFDSEAYKQNGFIINGCGDPIAYAFMLTYTLIVTLAVLNLFVAIILQNFEDLHNKENILINNRSMKNLRNTWAEYDPDATYFIDVTDFLMFLSKLGPPLGYKTEDNQTFKSQCDFLKKLEINTYGNMRYFYYYDVILSLTENAYLNLESEKHMLEFLMKDDINFDQLSAEVMLNIKKQLQFATDTFMKSQSYQDEIQVQDIEAYKSIFEQQQKIYSKVQHKKDQSDSLHLWATHRIKSLYKKTFLNFQRVLNKRPTTDSFVIEDLSYLSEEESEANNIEQSNQLKTNNLSPITRKQTNISAASRKASKRQIRMSPEQFISKKSSLNINDAAVIEQKQNNLNKNDLVRRNTYINKQIQDPYAFKRQDLLRHHSQRAYQQFPSETKYNSINEQDDLDIIIKENKTVTFQYQNINKDVINIINNNLNQYQRNETNESILKTAEEEFKDNEGIQIIPRLQYTVSSPVKRSIIKSSLERIKKYQNKVFQ